LNAFCKRRRRAELHKPEKADSPHKNRAMKKRSLLRRFPSMTELST
jgi:hypothetical protein